MRTLSPFLLIAAAQSQVSGGNLGPLARDPMPDRWGPPPSTAPEHRPWHTAFIDWVGFASHYNARTRTSNWPLPSAQTCTEMASYAEERGMLVLDPTPGDLFLLWSPLLGAFVRSGIVIDIAAALEHKAGRIYDCVTIEGNTSDDFSHHGSQVLSHERRLAPGQGDRFIHWSNPGSKERAA